MYIRKAENRDIPSLNKLLHQVLMVHHNGRPDLFKPDCTKYTDAQLEILLQDAEKPVFAAFDDADEMLGYAFCQIETYQNDNILTDRKTLYIDDICVDEKSRGQHVGTALYQHVMAFAKEIGCYNVTLNVWSCNPGAEQFYRAMGMQPYKIGMEMIVEA
ncbi:MAG: GNAT family N-acetyltransferase [Oscillospiraceae bacterium]|nr:GNAT family N-acetyltransferase [Oscillospiraceae bacterium]